MVTNMIHQQEKHADNVKNWNRISGVMVSVLASMFQSGEMCLSMDFVSVSLHYENPTKGVGLVQSRPHQHLIEN